MKNIKNIKNIYNDLISTWTKKQLLQEGKQLGYQIKSTSKRPDIIKFLLNVSQDKIETRIKVMQKNRQSNQNNSIIFSRVEIFKGKEIQQIEHLIQKQTMIANKIIGKKIWQNKSKYFQKIKSLSTSSLILKYSQKNDQNKKNILPAITDYNLHSKSLTHSLLDIKDEIQFNPRKIYFTAQLPRQSFLENIQLENKNKKEQNKNKKAQNKNELLDKSIDASLKKEETFSIMINDPFQKLLKIVKNKQKVQNLTFLLNLSDTIKKRMKYYKNLLKYQSQQVCIGLIQLLVSLFDDTQNQNIQISKVQKQSIFHGLVGILFYNILNQRRQVQQKQIKILDYLIENGILNNQIENWDFYSNQFLSFLNFIEIRILIIQKFENINENSILSNTLKEKFLSHSFRFYNLDIDELNKNYSQEDLFRIFQQSIKIINYFKFYEDSSEIVQMPFLLLNHNLKFKDQADPLKINKIEMIADRKLIISIFTILFFSPNCKTVQEKTVIYLWLKWFEKIDHQIDLTTVKEFLLTTSSFIKYDYKKWIRNNSKVEELIGSIMKYFKVCKSQTQEIRNERVFNLLKEIISCLQNGKKQQFLDQFEQIISDK